MRQPTDEELRADYYQLLAVVEAHRARFWLVDTHRRAQAIQQGVLWMLEHSMPLLPQRLAKNVRLAYLFMPIHLREIEQDVAVPPLTYFAGHAYHVQRFTEEQAAVQWLLACQAQEVDDASLSLR